MIRYHSEWIAYLLLNYTAVKKRLAVHLKRTFSVTILCEAHNQHFIDAV